MTVRNTKDFDGRWIRKASSSENHFEDNNLDGLFVLCYKLYLKSKSPLKEEQVKLALNHLYRKCPCLHFCFGYRDGTRWIRRSTNPEVDFKVVEGKQMEDTMKEILRYRFNTETGPLFCVRLLLNATDILEFEDDLEPSLPHSSHMIFGIHHSVGDGTTNALIMGYFSSLLNDVISGNAICDDEVFGTFVGGEYSEEVLEECREVLRGDPKLDAQIVRDMKSFKETTSFVATHFREPSTIKETHILEHVFDQGTTKEFLQKCRDEGITFNSGFSAAVAVALRDLLLEKGIIRDSYTFKSFSSVNQRRYWKTKITESLGIHIGYPLTTTTEVHRILDNGFWEYARLLHKSIQNALNSKKPLFHEAHLTMFAKYLQASVFQDKALPVFTDYNITNMGDITPLAFRGGDELKITHILRSASLGDLNKGLLLILCHTFRGKFTVTFAYNASALGRDFIQQYCSQIAKRMQNVSES